MSWSTPLNGATVAGETSSAVAARLIREAIIKGELPPGQPLREVELGRQMGISRTPVREALRLLQNDGLVEFQPNRGATVKSYSAADLEDVYNLRAALEGYAAQTAAARISDAQLVALNESCDRYESLRTTDDLAGLAAENLTFHTTIFAAADSDRLALMISQVTALPLIYKSYMTYSPENREAAETQHRQIAAALARHDGPDARRRQEAHVLWARDLALDNLSLLPS